MSKGHNKGRNNNGKKNNQPVMITLPSELSKEEMTDIIAKAMVRAEEMKEEEENNKQKSECDEWKKGIGIKDYSSKPLYFQIPLTIINLVWVFLKMPFTRRSKIKTEQATTELLRMTLNTTLMFICVVAFVFAIIMTSYVLPPSVSDFVKKTIFKIGATSVNDTFFNIIFAISAYLFAGLFRVASIEVDRIKDRNVLFGIFASFSSLWSIVIAIISLIIAISSKQGV